jgi:hypothetical protein
MTLLFHGAIAQGVGRARLSRGEVSTGTDYRFWIPQTEIAAPEWKKGRER